MSAPRDFSRASWRLKLARAEQHVKELELEIGRYASRHPYRARRVDEGDPQAKRVRWVLEITEQPDAGLGIVLGDVLTNLRASLDHIAVALAPNRPKNKAAWFPLVADVGLFNASPSPEQRAEYEKSRKSFSDAVKGMEPGAVAIIEELQPYHVNPFSREGTPQIHTLRELNRLVQADKHKDLIPIVTGLEHVRSFVVANTHVMDPGWYADFRDEGTVVGDVNFPNAVPSEAEVQVHIHGTPRITVNIVEGYGSSDVMDLVRMAIDHLATELFSSLEPFIPF